MSKKTVITGLVLATALASGWAGQAAANTAGANNAQRVSYADLDLTRSHDAKVLIERIQHAATRVCSVDGDVGYDRLSRSYRNCVRMASTKAVGDLASPMVTAAYESRSRVELATK